MILSEKVTQELKRTHQKLDNQGELPSKSQLAQYYETFRSRFGPEKLGNLDGLALLETMHDHSNKDSLVYWLEFKDDDELPAFFGSIAGGSALKFGIYKRKETGAWMTGHPTNQKEISSDEAVEIAKKHRDQLLSGLDLLEKLPGNGSDSDYEGLQQSMDGSAPDVSDMAWGHKYFSMLYPDKLDDYHSPEYQRFHLVKLLQIPPQGPGRYLCAGRYVAIAAEMAMPICHLTKILNSRNASPHRYWRIGTKLGGVDSRWDLMRGTGCVAVGWSDLGDLSGIAYNKKGKEELRTIMASNYPNNAGTVTRQTQQLFNYVAAIKEGDLVLASDGEKVLGIGKVVAGYSFEPGSDAPHRRLVEWLSLDSWKIEGKEGLRTTVYELKKTENLVLVEQQLVGKPPPIIPIPDGGQIALIPRLSGIPGQIQSVLDRKNQVILYGPPGTGKTHWAEAAALTLASYSQYGIPFEQLNQDEIRVVKGDNQGAEGLVRMCSFHPAYGYEDFIEGYRPQASAGQLVFERHDGIFKKLCEDATAKSTSKFYLIIDEINRGDIPRIFGELLTVIEKNKRGKPIWLPLSRKQFQVPSNVFVIATMNTADRSIALLDKALRRRFGFIELMPDSSVLGDTIIEGIPLAVWLDALNRRICEFIGRDARNLQIGHSYLLEASRPVTSFSRFVQVLQEDMLPLLEEYCYEDYSTLAKVLGKSLIDENNQRIRSELFDPARQSDLVQALLGIDPGIVTTARAIAPEIAAAEGEPHVDEDAEPEDEEPGS